MGGVVMGARTETAKMDAETLTALQGSIKKWEGIVARTGVDDGQDNCPLCQKFANLDDECNGCPVREKTGHMLCMHSPYDDWTDAAWDHHGRNAEFTASTPELVELAKKELDFLRSLLPT